MEEYTFFLPDCSQCTFSGFELEDDMSKNCDERGLYVVEIQWNAAYYIFKSDKIGIQFGQDNTC